MSNNNSNHDGLVYLERGAEQLGLSLSAVQMAQFAQYQALLMAWNRRLNLTRISDPLGIQVRHFLDALTCATVMGDLNGVSVVDVGTGAGFPGLPLKILYPQMRLTLVDSVAKKTVFLTAVVDALGLTDVFVVAERAETLGQNAAHRAKYDWAVARSVAGLPVLLEYLLPLCCVGGKVLAQKGESAALEVAEANRAIKTLGGGEAVLTAVQLPDHERVHYLVCVPKTAVTPAKYPRRPGKPSKKPI